VTDMKRITVGLILVGLVSILSGCANAIDVLCPPAGQCPNVRPGHGGGYWSVHAQTSAGIAPVLSGLPGLNRDWR